MNFNETTPVTDDVNDEARYAKQYFDTFLLKRLILVELKQR